MKAHADFLFEIGCEEIPARMIPRACEELQQLLEKHFQVFGIFSRPIKTLGAPRRLAALSDGVLLQQPDEVKEILGPPKSIAFDHVGRPTRAAQSFSEKQNVPLAKLQVVKTP